MHVYNNCPCLLTDGLQDCAGFLVTNEEYPYGCCYLKTSLRSENDLVPFPNNIVGQTYKKEFSGRGTAPAKIGYEFLNFKDYPNNDILGKCDSTLDACFDLCNTKTEVRAEQGYNLFFLVHFYVQIGLTLSSHCLHFLLSSVLV